MLTTELCSQAAATEHVPRATPDTDSHGQGQGRGAPAPTETVTVLPDDPSFLKSSLDSCNLSKPLGERVLREKFKVKSNPVT